MPVQAQETTIKKKYNLRDSKNFQSGQIKNCEHS